MYIIHIYIYNIVIYRYIYIYIVNLSHGHPESSVRTDLGLPWRTGKAPNGDDVDGIGWDDEIWMDMGTLRDPQPSSFLFSGCSIYVQATFGTTNSSHSYSFVDISCYDTYWDI